MHPPLGSRRRKLWLGFGGLLHRWAGMKFLPHRVKLGRGNHLRRHRIGKLRVAGCAKLGNVQSRDLHLGPHAVGSEDFSNQLEAQTGNDEIPYKTGGAGDELCDELR